MLTLNISEVGHGKIQLNIIMIWTKYSRCLVTSIGTLLLVEADDGDEGGGFQRSLGSEVIDLLGGSVLLLLLGGLSVVLLLLVVVVVLLSWLLVFQVLLLRLERHSPLRQSCRQGQQRTRHDLKSRIPILLNDATHLNFKVMLNNEMMSDRRA